TSDRDRAPRASIDAAALAHLAGLAGRRADAVLDTVRGGDGDPPDRGSARHRATGRPALVRTPTATGRADRAGPRPQETDARAARGRTALGAVLRRWRKPA